MGPWSVTRKPPTAGNKLVGRFAQVGSGAWHVQALSIAERFIERGLTASGLQGSPHLLLHKTSFYSFRHESVFLHVFGMYRGTPCKNNNNS